MKRTTYSKFELSPELLELNVLRGEQCIISPQIFYGGKYPYVDLIWIVRLFTKSVSAIGIYILDIFQQESDCETTLLHLFKKNITDDSLNCLTACFSAKTALEQHRDVYLLNDTDRNLLTLSGLFYLAENGHSGIYNPLMLHAQLNTLFK